MICKQKSLDLQIVVNRGFFTDLKFNYEFFNASALRFAKPSMTASREPLA